MKRYNRKRSYFRHKAIKAQKLLIQAEELISSYESCNKIPTSSPSELVKVPNKRPLKDARVRFNDYGVIKFAIRQSFCSILRIHQSLQVIQMS